MRRPGRGPLGLHDGKLLVQFSYFVPHRLAADCANYTDKTVLRNPRNPRLSTRTGLHWCNDSRSRFAELCLRNYDIRLHVIEFYNRLTVGPGYDPVKWQLHAGDLAIIGIVDLNGDGAHGSVAVT